MNKWDMILGSLFYALPLWLLLIPILIINFDKNGISNDIFALALVSMAAVWGIGFNLMRNNHLEEEIGQLKKKLNENKQITMNKAIKYIWVVETENIHFDGKSGGRGQSFFSTEDKAKSHMEWCMSCADKSDARLMEHDKDGLSAKYMLSNGDTWIIDTKRKALDLD